MLTSTFKSAAFAAIALAHVAAQASLSLTTPACHDAVLSPAYAACGGSFAGNDANQQADVSAFIASQGWGTSSYLGKSDDASFGPFTGNPQTPTGTLSFDVAQSNPFVLSLKAGNQFSLYYFDASHLPVSSIGFSTLGTNVNQRGMAQDLSHASLYSVTAVPEPETYALMMAGLGALGVVARRKRKA